MTNPSIERPDPVQLAAGLENSYASFWRVLSLLEPEELEQPCLHGGWSPKVLVAHVAFWDDFQTRRMQAALSGAWAESVPRPHEDNDARAARDAARDWDEIAAEADRNRRRMVAFAQGLTPEQIETVYREGGKERAVLQILLTHMARHVREHAAEILHYCGSLERWGRAGLRDFLIRQHEHLLDGIGGLHEETMTTVPVSDGWTVRDILAHVLAWEEYVVQVVRLWPDLEREALARWLVGESLDEVNARLRAETASLDMITLVDALSTAHRRLIARYDQLDDAAFEQEGDYAWGMRGTLSSFLLRMARHTAEHAAEIWEARVHGHLAPIVT